MKYDYILFENAYQLENHYLDLELLALAIKKAGYSVAIANVFKEESLCQNSSLDHISFRFKSYKYFRELNSYRTHVSLLRYSILRFLCNIYLLYAVYSLKKKTDNLYIGSLTIDTPLLWLIFLPLRKSYYIWGLRSYVIQKWKERLCERYGIYSLVQYYIIKHYTRIRLVVSNHIIKNEFEKIINKPANRFIVRPERWVADDYQIPKPISNRRNRIFLTIGTLRRNKHVELVLDALRCYHGRQIEYIIAGRCKDDNGYNEMIESRMSGLNNVRRIDRFIPDEEYCELFKEADYVILCDEPEKTCGTNGTFLESVLYGCPVIAPSHEPFLSEIGKNGVGLLYNMSDTQSLVKCIESAVCNGPSYYEKMINRYVDNLRESKVVKKIKIQLNEIN